MRGKAWPLAGTSPLSRPAAHYRMSFDEAARRRRRALRHAALRREYRHDALAISRAVQEQLLRRCLAEYLDGVDATRAGERSLETWSAGDGRAAHDENARRAALDQPEVTDKSDRRAASGLPRGGGCCYGKSAQLSTQAQDSGSHHVAGPRSYCRRQETPFHRS